MVAQILALDPANCTGWAVLDATGHLVEYGFFQIKPCEFVGDQLIEMMVQVKLLLDRFKPVRIVVEDYFFSRRCRQGANMNPAYRAAIHIVVRMAGLEYTIVSPANWKRFITGRVKPTKEEIKTYGKERAKKEMTRVALAERYNITFPDFLEKNGRQVKLKYDVVDATGMGLWYIRSQGLKPL